MEERVLIPSSVIAAVSDVLGGYYFSHSRLNTLFMENGAPGDTPMGNCVTKCSAWLKRCNDEDNVTPLAVLGAVLREFMDADFDGSFGEKWNPERERIRKALGKNGLVYQINGYVVKSGFTPASKSLTEIIHTRDFSAIEIEFNRAYESVQTDPAAGITAASSMIEAVCKTYIHDRGLDLPNKQKIQDLWQVVRNDLRLDPKSFEDVDQKKILSGLAAIVDGIGALRTHIGSAHGRGPDCRRARVREAKLAISASQALSVFILDSWISGE